jgi:hypothetical protein
MTAEATVSKLLEDWYRAMSPNWSPTTARQTRSVIDCHLVPGLGDVRLQTLRDEHIDAFYGELRRGGGRNGEPLSPGTVHRVHVVLHRALAQALRWEWLWVNPAASASPPSCEPAPIYPPSPRQAPKKWSDCSPPWLPSIPTSTRSWHSPSRPRLDEVSSGRSAGATSTSCRDRSGLFAPCSMPKAVRCCVREDSTYRVNLDRNCLELLVAHHARARRRADCSGVDIDRSSFVFSNEPDGATPWRPNWVTKRFITYLHDLRHFMATPVSPRESRSQGIQGGLPS